MLAVGANFLEKDNLPGADLAPFWFKCQFMYVLDFSLRVPGLLVRELLKASFLFFKKFHRLHKNYIIINYLIYRRHVRSRRQRGRFALATPTPGRASVF